MIIKGLRSGAVCRVKPVRIVTDNFGFARFCWFIPNPNAKGSPRWLTNGPKTFRLTDNKNDQRIKGTLDTAGQAKYEEPRELLKLFKKILFLLKMQLLKKSN